MRMQMRVWCWSDKWAADRVDGGARWLPVPRCCVRELLEEQLPVSLLISMEGCCLKKVQDLRGLCWASAVWVASLCGTRPLPLC